MGSRKEKEVGEGVSKYAYLNIFFLLCFRYALLPLALWPSVVVVAGLDCYSLLGKYILSKSEIFR